MRYINYLFVWIFLILFGFPSHAFFGKYPIQNFTPVDYQAGIQNIDFAQNRNMTLFVANNLGVLSYNGADWEVHGLQSGKKQRSLAFDQKTNRLYVGSQGEFGFFDTNWVFTSLTNLIPSAHRNFDEVWDVFLFNSKVYFCTFQHIYVLDGQQVTVIEHPDGFDRSFQVAGKLFTQSQGGELLEIKNDKLVSVFEQNRHHQTIAGVISMDEDYLLFYNSGQIEFSSAYNTTVEHYKALSDALQGTFVNHVLQLSDTRLSISTQTAGIFLYDVGNHSIEHIDTENGLQANACLRSFQDYSGNLWVGMQSGMALIHINSPIRLVNKEINIQGSGYEAYDTEDGRYFSTSNGIYYLAKNSSQTVFIAGTEGPAYGFQKIAGQLYGGHHSGLYRLNHDRATRIVETDGLWQIKQLRSNPTYAVAGTYSGLFLFSINKNKSLQPEGKIKGFNESSRFFEEDHQGRIIVGQYYKGLYELQLENDLRSVSVNKLSDNYDLPIKEQIILSKIDNELYVGTNGGAYFIDQSKDNVVLASFIEKGIGTEQIYLLKQDQLKNIHTITNNKVGFFKKISANNYAFVPSSLFQLQHFLNNDLLQASVHVDDGIMFSANEGFLHYDPTLEERVTVKAPLTISKVYSVSQDAILYQRGPFNPYANDTIELEIDHKAKILQFNIESFQFHSTKNQQFRYFLKGFDQDYSEWTKATIKEYTNLKEGNYEFIAQTRNYLGEATTSTPLYLKVKPPFFRSTLAKFIYLAIGLILLFLVSRIQKQQYKKKTQLIEEKKQGELEKKQQELVKVEQEKEEKLSQLEAEKEQELSLLEAEKIESELRHLNNLLAASTMNLVVKNEFIENIKNELKEVRKKGKHVETKQALERIEREIDSTLRLQEDWKQFEHHFDQVHGDFLTRLREEFSDLSPNDQKLCAFLRLNLNTKEIANLMNISLRGVEVARYRLRKKLGLVTGTNLSKFILEY